MPTQTRDKRHALRLHTPTANKVQYGYWTGPYSWVPLGTCENRAEGLAKIDELIKQHSDKYRYFMNARSKC